MSSPDDPRSWLQAWPDVAALVAGGLAVLIRTSNADSQRHRCRNASPNDRIAP